MNASVTGSSLRSAFAACQVFNHEGNHNEVRSTNPRDRRYADFCSGRFSAVVPYKAGAHRRSICSRRCGRCCHPQSGAEATEQTGQTFFVENSLARDRTIGTQFVARAAPDGYTLLAIDNTYSMLPYVFKKLPFDRCQCVRPDHGKCVYTRLDRRSRADSPYVLMVWHRNNDCSCRLARIPGVGPIVASMLVMKTPPPRRSARLATLPPGSA